MTAPRPVQGGNNGTWGTDLNAHLDVSIDQATGNLKTAAVQAALGGSMPAVAYRLASDGTTVNAYDKLGASVASGTDTGAVFNAVIALLPAAGGSIAFRNDGLVFPLTTSCLLPKSVTRKLYVQGNGSILQVQGTAVCAFRLNRTADYDTFTNIAVDGFVVDRNNLASATANVIVDIVSGQRVNIDGLTLTNLSSINVPTEATNPVKHIGLTCKHLGAAETQTSIKNVLIRDISVAGAAQGVSVEGFCATASAVIEVFLDNITVENVTFDSLVTPTAAGIGAGVIIGNQGFGNRCLVRNCYLQSSSDVGVEVDGMTNAVVENCEAVDCWKEGFFFRNYHAPQNVETQVMTWRNCRARVASLGVADTNNHGFVVNATAAPTSTLGHVIAENCQFTASGGIDLTNRSGVALFAQAGVKKLTLHDFNVAINGVADTSSGSTFNTLIDLAPTVACTLTMARTKIQIAGTTTNTGARLRLMSLSGASTIAVQGVEIDVALTGMGAGRTIGVNLGNVAGTMRGTIEGIRVIQWTDDTAPVGVLVNSTTNLTISPRLDCRDCDWSAMPAGCTEFSIDATQTTKVFLRANRWKNFPAPSSLTGLVTATGLAIGKGWPTILMFLQGTGAAITAIDISTDGGTTYTNYLTQASAALPGGYSQSIGPFETDTLVKVTFTTTQPTIKRVPVNP